MTDNRYAVAAGVLRTLGADVSRVRVERGMTQTDVALATGLAPTVVSYVERGYHSPSVDRALALLNWLAHVDDDDATSPAASHRERGSPLLRSTTTTVANAELRNER